LIIAHASSGRGDVNLLRIGDEVVELLEKSGK
jgi:hypothetical protein